MSDKEKDKKKPAPDLPVTPDASNPEFAEWLEQLWDGEFFEKVIVVQLFGRNGDQRGAIIDTVTFTRNSDKPSKEKIVSMSNRLLGAAQRDCDMLKHPQNYCIESYNTFKSADPYARFPLALSVKTKHLVVKNDANGYDDEVEGKDGFGGDKLLRRVDNIDKSVKDERENYMAAQGQIMSAYQTMNSMLMEHNRLLTRENFALTQQMASMMKDDKLLELQLAEKKFWLGAMDQAKDTVLGLAPTLVNRFIKQDVLPVENSPEFMVVKNFMQRVEKTPERFVKVFGQWANGECTSQGILTAEQSTIVANILHKSYTTDYLDHLIEGPHVITPEQLAQLAPLFEMEELMPLGDILQQRRNRKVKK